MWSIYKLNGDTFYLMFQWGKHMATRNTIWDAFGSLPKKFNFV
jgi:hypothetical protein